MGKNAQKVLIIGLMSMLLAGLALYIRPAITYAASVSATAPNPNNSDPRAAHVFYLRSSVNQGQQREIRLESYYTASTADLNNQYITIRPGGGPSADTPEVCTVKPGVASDPSRFLKVTLSNGSTNNVYYISEANTCRGPVAALMTPGDNANNQLYARFALPPRPADPDAKTQLYKVDITIEYGSTVPSSKDAGGIRMVVSDSTPGAKISAGSGTYSYPIVGDYSRFGVLEDGINIPFGLCSTGTRNDRKVGIYDADAGGFPGSDIKFKIFKVTGSTTVVVPMKIAADSNGTIGSTGFFKPNPASNKEFTYVNIDMDASAHYELRITGLNPKNTIDIKLPGSSIYGDPDVCPPPGGNPGDPTIAEVKLVGTVSTSGAAEVGTTAATYSGAVHIYDFPQPQSGGWSFSERATRKAPNSRVQPNITDYGVFIKDCPSDPNDGNPTKYIGAGGNERCEYKYNPEPNNQACRGNYSGEGSGNARRCVWRPSVDQVRTFRCQDPDLNGPAVSNRASLNCRKQYNCPNGGTLDGNAGGGSNGWREDGNARCNSWICTYNAPAPYDREQIDNPTNNEPTCSYRCSGGNGIKAYLASNDSRGWFMKDSTRQDPVNETDIKCFKVPVFTLNCVYTYTRQSDGMQLSSRTVSEEVNGETMREDVGNPGRPFCSVPSNGEGQPDGVAVVVAACISVDPNAGAGWTINAPGYAIGGGANAVGEQQKNYVFRSTPDGPECASFFSKPFLRIYGGDVSVGSGVKSPDAATCGTANAAAIIKTGVSTASGYNGSGAQGAAFASGSITGFISGQYNNLSKPKSLSFANNNASGEFGGGFGAAKPCADLFNDNFGLVTGATTRIITGGTLDATDTPTGSTRFTSDGNLVIRGNVTNNGANTPWSDVGGISRNLILVKGDVFIDKSVTRIDATIAATGTIYTCSDGATPIDATYSGCNNQLVINGALVAKQVRFTRDCGTLGLANDATEAPMYDTIANNQTECNPSGNHAAEVINYTPDLWISDAPAGISTGYDAISNLPPIL